MSCLCRLSLNRKESPWNTVIWLRWVRPDTEKDRRLQTAIDELVAETLEGLDAARACFSCQGFPQTTMQDICREVGTLSSALD